MRPMYPGNVTMCDGFHTRCYFNKALTNVEYKNANCTCLPSCSSVQVSTSETVRPKFYLDDFCEDNEEQGQIYIGNLLKPIGDPLKYQLAMGENNMTSLLKSNLSNIEETCKAVLDKHEIAFLTLELTSTFGTRIVQDVRVTLSDKIGTFGNQI